MSLRLGLIIVAASISAGCATQGVNSLKYTAHAAVQVNNEITVPKPQSQVWDILVKKLSKSSYVINTIDKGSRIINVSFSSTSPVEYVDCGRSHRTYVQGDKTEIFDYDVAGPAEFKLAAERKEAPSFSNYMIIRRETVLESGSNIYVAPDEKDNGKTIVTVNTRYILNIKAKGEAFAQHVIGNVLSRGRLPEESTMVTFSTNRAGQQDIGGGLKMTCFGKGRLEGEILEMAKGDGK
jgi:hypothetical protein